MQQQIPGPANMIFLLHVQLLLLQPLSVCFQGLILSPLLLYVSDPAASLSLPGYHAVSESGFPSPNFEKTFFFWLHCDLILLILFLKLKQFFTFIYNTDLDFFLNSFPSKIRNSSDTRQQPCKIWNDS